MNDKQKLMEKADALRRDLSELDAQIAKMKTEPESVKPIIIGPFMGNNVYIGQNTKGHVLLQFDSLEQAEKAKAILEKMEFGEMPNIGAECERLTNKTWYDETWNGDHYQKGQWHMGTMRVK